jgi:hypothetical protein
MSVSPPTPLQLAWAAGFIDGDGSIGAYWEKQRPDRNNATLRIRLTVTQNDLPTLQHLQVVLNEKSTIYPVKRTRFHNKPVWTLVLNGTHALIALRKLSGFLVRKLQEYLVCEELHASGQLSERPGRRGHTPSVAANRRALAKKLVNLK